ncbi:MAG: hypothetical protein PHX83_16145 [Acidobacteriia bacterium]|nr:hypothetical protein [Terriglobia bacterium]
MFVLQKRREAYDRRMDEPSKQHHGREYFFAGISVLGEFLAVKYGINWLAWLFAILLCLSIYEYAGGWFSAKPVLKYGIRALSFIVIIVITVFITRSKSPERLKTVQPPQQESGAPPPITDNTAKTSTAPSPTATSPALNLKGREKNGSETLVSVDLVFKKSASITAYEKKEIASDAQNTASEILNCVATSSKVEETPCGVWATRVTSVRDNLHNGGIECPELNKVVGELESKPSNDTLSRSAYTLRAVAEKLLFVPRPTAISENMKTEPHRVGPTTQTSPPALVIGSNPAPTPESSNQTQKAQGGQITPKNVEEVRFLLDPIIIGTAAISPRDEQSISSCAQDTAARILSCVVSYPENDGKVCSGVYGTQVVSIRDELHNHGIEFAELNSVVGQLESNPTIELLRRTAMLLRALADKLLAMAQQPPKAIEKDHASIPQRKPLPTKISIALPKKIQLGKYEIGQLSEDSSDVSAELKVCILDQRSRYRETEAGVAQYCNSQSAKKIITIRNKLKNAQVELDLLDDVVNRMESGATVEELQYIAKAMEALSTELGKRAKLRWGLF